MNGDRLRRLREKAGYSQQELAKQVGIGSRQIWRYENNETTPDGDTIALIARVLNVSADFLLGLTSDPTPRFHDEDLSEKERAVIAAWRRGEYREAIKVIVADE